jgi:mannitol operon repressor
MLNHEIEAKGTAGFTKAARRSSLCAQLQMAAKPYAEVTVNTRGQFTSAAVSLILNLTNRPHYVGQRRLQAVEWKI